MQAAGSRVPVEVQWRAGARTRLQVKSGVPVLLTAEKPLSAATLSWLEQQRPWLEKQLARTAQAQHLRRQFCQNDHTEVWVFGRRLPLHVQPAAHFHYRFTPESFTLSAPAHHLAGPHGLKPLLGTALRRMAHRYLPDRLTYWATELDMRRKLHTIRVKDLRSRWGSCSTAGNINLNWYLIMVDLPCLDYVLVHELMHLREMNHSSRFWAHVASVLPDYRQLRHRLHAQEWVLGLYSPEAA